MNHCHQLNGHFRKHIFAFFTVLCFTQAAMSQLYLSPGATFHLSGNAEVTLQNINLVNDGTISAPGNGRFIFNGNANNEISGAAQPNFAELEIAKTGIGQLMLQRNIGIKDKIHFSSNLIDLNTHNIELGTAALLENENENSRITGINGGQVLFTTNLNAPVAVNPANLGIIISSAQNLGTTIIRRGHEPQAINSEESIFRYYDIVPSVNSSLDATLRIHYFDAELNGNAEDDLVHWQSADNISWTNEGNTANDNTLNYVEQNAYTALFRQTLLNNSINLPLVWGEMHTRCENGAVNIYWQTLQEINTRSFVVQSSPDGIIWTDVVTLAAAGNSNFTTNYQYTDKGAASLYRIRQYDIDGRNTLSKILRNQCSENEPVKVYPNPVTQWVTVDLFSKRAEPVSILLIDNKGARVQEIEERVLAGMNRLRLDMGGLASGIYWLQIRWKDGKEKQVKLVKTEIL